ncbi:cytochrome c oxidase assembly protein [Psychrobacillus sp. FSL W7-1493]|uniref:cytochrome c oxidase assembly protein n=1 Tax=unclassified Psychrobacillus TaxID=2636677 RepID=UPI004046C312
MHSHSHESSLNTDFVQIILGAPFVLLLFLYLYAVLSSNKSKKKWPIYRTVLWILGIALAMISVTGNLAQQAHTDFVAHMVGHLFLGMLAPLLLALAAPMTLFLRTLPVKISRKITGILRTRFVHFFQNPIVASVLNVGGLWLLYTTPLFAMMHEGTLVYIIIHIHIFLAGYLFTISIIYIDPTPYRKSYVYRSVVFIFALAGHAILSKYIYANPPLGISREEAEMGGMIMYYGGDAIEIGLIVILYYHWFKQTRPKAEVVNPKPINGKEELI